MAPIVSRAGGGRPRTRRRPPEPDPGPAPNPTPVARPARPVPADAVMENENSKSEWFKKTNPYYAAGIAIAPSSLIGVLPIGSLFYMNASISAGSFISCIILSMGLIFPLIQALRYTDSLAMVNATVQEIGNLLDTEEMKRPEKPVQLDGEVSLQNRK